MTFEGETKVLPIKGIERAGADNLCEDGAMNEVVGLEYKDGSYVPYAARFLGDITIPNSIDKYDVVPHEIHIPAKIIINNIEYERHKEYDKAEGIYAWMSDNRIVYSNRLTDVRYVYDKYFTTNEIFDFENTITSYTPEHTDGDIYYPAEILVNNGSYTPRKRVVDEYDLNAFDVERVISIPAYFWEQDAVPGLPAPIFATQVLNNVMVGEKCYKPEQTIFETDGIRTHRLTVDEFIPERTEYSEEETRSITIVDISKILEHKTSNGQNRIYLSTSGDVFYYNTYNEEWRIICSYKNVKDIAFVGNVICMSCDGELEYRIFREEKYDKYINNYNVFVENPVFLRVTRGLINPDAEDERSSGEEVKEYTGAYVYKHNVPAFSKEDVTDNLIVAKGLATEHGGLVGCYLALYAWRLKNGELGFISAPVLLNSVNFQPGRGKAILDNGSRVNQTEYGTYPNNVGFTDDSSGRMEDLPIGYCQTDILVGARTGNYKTAPPFVSTLKYTNLQAADGHWLAYVLTNKLQIKCPEMFPSETDIDSLCIYLSPEIDVYRELSYKHCDVARENSVGFSCWSYYPKLKGESRIINEIIDTKTFYLVKEIGVDKLALYSKWTDIDLSGCLGDNLLVRESLQFNKKLPYGMISPSLNTYNYRLHAYNYIQVVLNKIIGQIYFYEDNGVGQEEAAVVSVDREDVVKIEVDVKVKNSDETYYLSKCYTKTGLSKFSISINPYVAYLGIGVEELIIRILHTHNGNKTYYLKSFALNNFEHLNISRSILSRKITVLDEQTTDIPEDLPVIQSHNPTSFSGNKLAVSDVSYPSYFDTSHVYTIGNESIIGLANLSITLSQDTFGLYPLLAFCSDGIYSLGVDSSGSGTYTTITPFSREVCINKNTICPIDGAVLFSTTKGLMMATRNGVEHFAINLNGEPKHLPQNNNDFGAGLMTFGKLISTKGATELWDQDSYGCISYEDFIDYLKEPYTCISYVSIKNKIIVYNKNKNYVFWIDIPTRNTTKLKINITTDNNNYPNEEYFKLGNTRKSYVFDYLSDSSNSETMFQTRPIKIAKGLKGVFNVVLRGYFRNDATYDNGKHYFAELLVLGSLDGTHWSTIGIKEKALYGGFHDLGCKTDRVSCNYIMICFSGMLQPDKKTQEGLTDEIEGSHVDSIEITLEGRDDGKR